MPFWSYNSKTEKRNPVILSDGAGHGKMKSLSNYIWMDVSTGEIFKASTLHWTRSLHNMKNFWVSNSISFSILVQSFFYCFKLFPSMRSESVGPSSSGFPLPVLTQCVSLGRGGGCCRDFCLWLLCFLIFFLYAFQEAVSAPRVLNILIMHINFLGQNFVLNLFTTTLAAW